MEVPKEHFINFLKLILTRTTNFSIALKAQERVSFYLEGPSDYTISEDFSPSWREFSCT